LWHGNEDPPGSSFCFFLAAALFMRPARSSAAIGEGDSGGA
jgi:hypothetical protein